MAYFRCGGGGIPSSLKSGMNDVLNKKFGTSTTYPPADWPDTVNLMGPLPIKTASGSVASFIDGADDVPISDALFSIGASQGPGTPSPSNYLPISGFHDMIVSHCGRNLFNKTDTTSDGYVPDKFLNDSGSEVTNSVCSISPYIRISPSTDYVVSGFSGTNLAFCFYDKDKTFLSGTKYGSGPDKTALSPATAYYVRLTIEDANIDTLQFELGTTASTYTPFSIETLPISWQTEAGDIYGGYIDLANNKLIQTHALYEFKGTETFVYRSNTYLGSFYARFDYFPQAGDGNSEFLCTHAAYVDNFNDYVFGKCIGGTYCNVWLKNSDWSSHQEVRNALKALYENETPLAIAYKLVTPIEHSISAIAIPSSYYGKNSFWNNTNGETAISYRADIQLALNS